MTEENKKSVRFVPLRDCRVQSWFDVMRGKSITYDTCYANVLTEDELLDSNFGGRTSAYKVLDIRALDGTKCHNGTSIWKISHIPGKKYSDSLDLHVSHGLTFYTNMDQMIESNRITNTKTTSSWFGLFKSTN